MDESKRYNEPKKLGDILKDMGMDAESIHKNKTSQEITKSTTNNLKNMMHVYIKLINKLDITYQKAILLINNMDAYYASERKYLLQAKRLVTEGKLTQEDINIRMQIILENLDYFEKEHNTINKSLRKTIKKFPYPADQQDQDKKANELYDLFIDIYTDIENILACYSELLGISSKNKGIDKFS